MTVLLISGGLTTTTTSRPSKVRSLPLASRATELVGSCPGHRTDSTDELAGRLDISGPDSQLAIGTGDRYRVSEASRNRILILRRKKRRNKQ